MVPPRYLSIHPLVMVLSGDYDPEVLGLLVFIAPLWIPTALAVPALGWWIEAKGRSLARRVEPAWLVVGLLTTTLYVYLAFSVITRELLP